VNASECAYRFGPFVIDTQRRLLLREGAAVPLSSKGFDILLFLVQKRDEVVDKADLLAAVWPEQIVEESNLTVNISALRKALGERPGEHRYVVTVPGRGYKFAAPALEASTSDSLRAHQPLDSGESAVIRPARSPVLSRRTAMLLVVAASLTGAWLLRARFRSEPHAPNSVAVLPFRSLVASDDGGLLELGLPDMLATKLSRYNDLVVRPANSVSRAGSDRDPLEAGRALGAESVVDGAIHHIGSRIRVTVRLLRVQDGASLWAGSFDEPYDDVLKVEDAISERVAQSLHAGLSPRRMPQPPPVDTRNPEAHRLYLVGRFHWNKMSVEGWKASIEYFNRALELDGRYALAHAGLAAAYVSLGSEYLPPTEAMAKARQAAAAALEIDETLAAAHISLGLVKAYYDWDWKGAGREFDRAVDLEPNSPDAHRERGLYLTTLGRSDEAIRATRKAQELDPLSPISNFAVGWALIGARRYAETIDHFRMVREIHPLLPAAFNLTGMAHLGSKRYESAAADFGRAAGLNPDSLVLKAELAFAFGKEHLTPKAEAILEELHALSRHRYVSPYYFALIYAGMGNENQALDWLQRAYRDRSRRLWALNVVPMWDDLRSDVQFTNLLRRIGLKE